MKKILGIALIVTAFTISTQAQEKQKPTEVKIKAKKEWNKKSKESLNLSADQEKQMKTLNTQFRDQAKAIKADKTLTEEQRKEKMRALHIERTTKVKAILTPEQQQKVAQQRKQHRKNGRKEVSTK